MPTWTTGFGTRQFGVQIFLGVNEDAVLVSWRFRSHFTSATMEHHIEIDLNKCLCVHSLLQLVDVSLQTILYSRGMIPEPYASLSTNESPKSQQFLDLYGKVCKFTNFIA
jgi:hypothetical protein